MQRSQDVMLSRQDGRRYEIHHGCHLASTVHRTLRALKRKGSPGLHVAHRVQQIAQFVLDCIVGVDRLGDAAA